MWRALLAALLTAGVTSWTARLDVVRTTDGATRLSEPELQVADFEEDCDDPRSSHRFTAEQPIAESVRKVLATLLRPLTPSGGALRPPPRLPQEALAPASPALGLGYSDASPAQPPPDKHFTSR